MLTVQQILLIEEIFTSSTIDVAKLYNKCCQCNMHLNFTLYPILVFSIDNNIPICIQINLNNNTVSIDIKVENSLIVIREVNCFLRALQINERIGLINNELCIMTTGRQCGDRYIYDKYFKHTAFNYGKLHEYLDNKINANMICNDCRYYCNSAYLYCTVSPYGYGSRECTYIPK